MITIIAPEEELKKIRDMLCENDCKGFHCTKSQMRRCLREPEKCPYYHNSIRYIEKGSLEYHKHRCDIYREIDKECLIEDIQSIVNELDGKSLGSRTANEVINDRPLMEAIAEKFQHRYDVGDGYWNLIENCITETIGEGEKR